MNVCCIVAFFCELASAAALVGAHSVAIGLITARQQHNNVVDDDDFDNNMNDNNRIVANNKRR